MPTTPSMALELARQAMAGRDFETLDRVIAYCLKMRWLDVVNRILPVCPIE